MARVKSLAAKKHKKIKKLAKGFVAARRKRFGAANEAVMHAGAYAYHGRKLKKRDLRSLWIVRLSAAAKANGTSYSRFIKALKEAKIEMDRKVLSHIAATDSATFSKIVAKTKKFTSQ
ncbi:50S ribosomal protein L20 [Candidatus Microgenomates bacterium]|nr:50S ribosomal protein L20 [Candidatus Microgenomates bacterium]